jgi:hypothetical protein
MTDDPTKKKLDSKLVSKQDHEVEYLMRKHNISKARVLQLISKYGPSRAEIEKHI